MSDPYYGEIKSVAFDYAPVDWAFCNGQSLTINQNEVLYSLISTIYGGNGTTFALPDLRGRVPIHQGTGPNMTQRIIGQQVGTETVTLQTAQLPAHNHTLYCNSTAGTVTTPVGNVPALTANPQYATSNDDQNLKTTLSQTVISPVGGSLNHNNMMPFLTINYIICINNGIFPNRD